MRFSVSACWPLSSPVELKPRPLGIAEARWVEGDFEQEGTEATEEKGASPLALILDGSETE
jgi:hypothetical protein